MLAAPPPPNERSRLQALQALKLLDTAAEPGYDALVRAAALACGTPISLISLVDAERQWFKANHGLEDIPQTPREIAFCAHAIGGRDIFEVPDAAQDARFSDNPLVTGAPDIRFYAGVPLTLHNGDAVGTLCVIDRAPRQLRAEQRELLQLLGEAAVQLMEQRQRLLQTEARLQQSQAQFRDAAVVLFLLDAQGRLVEANARMRQLWRQPLLALLDAGWLDGVHADDQARVRAAWERSRVAGQPLTLRLRLRGEAPPLRLLLRLQPLADSRWVGSAELDLGPPD